MVSWGFISWQGVLTAICILLFVYGWRPVKRFKYRNIPGPPALWLLGNIIDLVRKDRPVALEDWAEKYGTVYKYFQGGTVIVVVADPAAAKTINMRNHSRAPVLALFAGKEGKHDQDGIVIAPGGAYWQALRQAWQAMFHPDSLRGYIGFVNQSADNLVHALAPAAKSEQPVELWRQLGRLTLEVVGSSAFGMELQCFDSRKVPLEPDSAKIVIEEDDDDDVVAQKVAAMQFGFSGVFGSLYTITSVLFPELKPIIGRLIVIFPDRGFKRLIQARQLMRALCHRLIRNARTMAEKATTAGGAGAPDAARDGEPVCARKKVRGLPPGGFVQHLLRADNKLLGRPFSDDEIASQINSFMLAGYETTASALAFTCYHLATNPEAERKLLEEIDAFGRTREPTYDDLSSLPYLTACLDESLRLSPPGNGTLRLNKETIQLCGLTIPKGAYVNTAIYTYQRSSKYWDDPLAYKPERMLSGPGTNNPAWAPFGEGGRACVGVRLVYVEARIALIKLYRHYTFRLTPGQVPLETKTTITYQPKKGVYVTVHPRG